MTAILETALILFIMTVLSLGISACFGTLHKPRDHGNIYGKKRRSKH